MIHSSFLFRFFHVYGLCLYIQLFPFTFLHRTDTKGEVANQDMHMPYPVPKVPGRFYYYFGKPIETKGMFIEIYALCNYNQSVAFTLEVSKI